MDAFVSLPYHCWGPFVWLLLHGHIMFLIKLQAGPDGWTAFHPALVAFFSHHITGAIPAPFIPSAVWQAAWD